MTLIIESISPTGIIGTPGDTIQFSAVVTGATGTPSYVWNFGGGGTADDVTSATPNVVLGSVAGYSGFLTVADGAEMATRPFTFEVVDVPVVQSVTPTGSAGLPLGVVQFSATILGSPTSFDWTFSGGVLPTTSSAEEPVVTLQNPGNYSGVLVASNGNGDSEAFPFSFTVDAPVAPSWTFVKVGANETAPDSLGLNAQVVNGHLVLVYYSGNSIRFTRATTEFPTTESDFVSHTIVSGGAQCRGAQFLTFDEAGIPYVMFGTGEDSSSNTYRLARASSSEPSATADWHFSDIETKEGTKWDPVALKRQGTRLLAVWNFNGRLQFAFSDDLEPAEPANWTRSRVNEVSNSSAPYLFSGSGHLYLVAMRLSAGGAGLLDLDWTEQELPDGEADWSGVPLLGFEGGYTFQPRMMEWDGLPVIIATAPPSHGNRQAELHFLTTPEPEPGRTDLITTRISPENQTTGSYNGILTEGRLVVLHGATATGLLSLSRQVSVDPTQPTSWQVSSIASWNATDPAPAEMLLLRDRIVIAYKDITDGRLTLAIADGVY